MEDTIIDNMYRSVDIIEEIKDLDQQSKRIQNSAKLLVNDNSGLHTINTLSFSVKDMRRTKEQLSDLYKANEKNSEQNEITHPVLALFSKGTIGNPIDKEYEIHSDNTDKMVHHLNPSESLLILNQLNEILMARRDKLIKLLESTFPGYSPGLVAGLEGGRE
tara:strand:+ start:12819 stop:13304 length:486 start_codon:yes stop_codon:yes gene_type:complete